MKVSDNRLDLLLLSARSIPLSFERASREFGGEQWVVGLARERLATFTVRRVVRQMI